MNKLVKQLVALGLISVMVTGCSTNTVETPKENKTPEKTEQTSKSETENKETKTETETKKEEVAEKTEELPFPEYRNEKGEIDLKGETVKILWNIPEQSDDWIPYFEETYNGKIEIEFADWGDVETKLATSVASGDPADITYIYASWYPRHIVSNFLEPVDEYMPLAETLTKEDDIHYFSEEEMEYFKWKGDNYVFTTEDGQVDMAFYYNVAMLDEAGLEHPYELEKRGEWTWEKLMEYADALTVDKDGDGETDQYGLENRDMRDMFLASNDTDLIRLPKEAGDPEASHRLDDPATLNSLKAFEDMVASGNVGGEIVKGTAAMAYRSAGLAKELTPNFTTDGWGFCGAPKGPDNTEDKKASMHSAGWGIIKGSKNPVAATIALHCMLNRPEGEYISDDPEVLPFNGYKSQEDFDRMKEYMMDSTKVYACGIGIEGLGEKPLATAIEESLPVIEEKLSAFRK